MKIHFLGTCAGTEPMPGRRHTAMILESGNKFYQFDAGEGCSYTAYAEMKLDLKKFLLQPNLKLVILRRAPCQVTGTWRQGKERRKGTDTDGLAIGLELQDAKPAVASIAMPTTIGVLCIEHHLHHTVPILGFVFAIRSGGLIVHFFCSIDAWRHT